MGGICTKVASYPGLCSAASVLDGVKELNNTIGKIRASLAYMVKKNSIYSKGSFHVISEEVPDKITLF